MDPYEISAEMFLEEKDPFDMFRDDKDWFNMFPEQEDKSFEDFFNDKVDEIMLPCDESNQQFFMHVMDVESELTDTPILEIAGGDPRNTIGGFSIVAPERTATQFQDISSGVNEQDHNFGGMIGVYNTAEPKQTVAQFQDNNYGVDEQDHNFGGMIGVSNIAEPEPTVTPIQEMAFGVNEQDHIPGNMIGAGFNFMEPEPRVTPVQNVAFGVNGQDHSSQHMIGGFDNIFDSELWFTPIQEITFGSNEKAIQETTLGVNKQDHSHGNVSSSSSCWRQRNRRKVVRWTEKEHRDFLSAMDKYGRDWKRISQLVLPSRTPFQLASHAQKYFLRQQSTKKQRASIHDITAC